MPIATESSTATNCSSSPRKWGGCAAAWVAGPAAWAAGLAVAQVAVDPVALVVVAQVVVVVAQVVVVVAQVVVAQVAVREDSAAAAALPAPVTVATGPSGHAGPSDARRRFVHVDAVMVGMIGRP